MALALNVNLVDEGKTKSMRFMQEMTVLAACKIIHEKTNSGGAEYGLFQPGQFGPTKNGRWLRMDKLLLHYDLVAGDEVVYKKKHRSVKIKVLDGSVRMMKADESLVIQDIVENITKKLGLSNWAEYSLKIEGTNPREWLVATETLHENGVTDTNTVLELRKRYWLSREVVDKSDMPRVRLLFFEVRDCVVAGAFPMQKAQAAQLAALQYQAEEGFEGGDFSKKFVARRYLSPHWTKKKIEKAVAKEHKKVASMSADVAMFRYVQLARSFPTYGVTSFDVQTRTERKGSRKPKVTNHCLCISKNTILELDADTLEVNKKYLSENLHRWASGKRKLVLDFGQAEDDVVNYVTVEGAWIAQLLRGYADFAKRMDEKAKELTQVEEDSQQLQLEELEVEELDFEAIEIEDDVMCSEAVQNAIASANSFLNSLTDGDLDDFTDTDAVLAWDDSQLDAEQLALGSGAKSSLQRAMLAVQLAQDADWDGLDSCANALEAELGRVVRRAAVIVRAVPAQRELVLPSATAVSEAVVNVLSASRAVRAAPHSKQAKVALKMSRLSVRSAEMLLAAQHHGMLLDRSTRSLVEASGDAVQSSAARLTRHSVRMAQEAENHALEEVAQSTETVADGVASAARVLAPTLAEVHCRQHVQAINGTLRSATSNLLNAFDEEGVRDPALATLASRVTSTVGVLDSVLALAAAPDAPVHCFGEASEKLEAAAARLRAATTPKEAVGAYKDVALESRALLQFAQHVAVSNPALQRKMTTSSRQLTTQLKTLSEGVVLYAQTPTDQQRRLFLNTQVGHVSSAAEKMRAAARQYELDVRVRDCVKQTSGSACSLASALEEHAAESAEVDKVVAAQVTQARVVVLEAMKAMATAAELSATPHKARLVGLRSAQKLTGPMANLLQVAKKTVRLVDDADTTAPTEQCIAELDEATKSMLAAADAAEVAGGTRFIVDAQAVAASCKENVEASQLKARGRALTGGHSGVAQAEARAHAMQAVSKHADGLRRALNEATLTVKVAPSNIGGTLAAAQDGLRGMFANAITIASETANTSTQQAVLAAAATAAASVEAVLADMLVVASDPDAPTKIDEHVQEFQRSMLALENEARGLKTKEIEAAIARIAAHTEERVSERLGAGGGAAASASPTTASVLLQKHAVALHSGVSNVVSTTAVNVQALGSSATALADGVEPLFAAMEQVLAACALDTRSLRAVREAAVRVPSELVSLLEAAMAAAAGGHKRDAALTSACGAAQDALRTILEGFHPGVASLIEAMQAVEASVASLSLPPPEGEEPMAEPFRSLAHALSACKNAVADVAGVCAASGEAADVGAAAKRAAAQFAHVSEACAALPLQAHEDSRVTMLAEEMLKGAEQMEANATSASLMLSQLKPMVAAAKECLASASKTKAAGAEGAALHAACEAVMRGAADAGGAVKQVVSKKATFAAALSPALRTFTGAVRTMRDAAVALRRAELAGEGRPTVAVLVGPASEAGAALTQLMEQCKQGLELGGVQHVDAAGVARGSTGAERALTALLEACAAFAPGRREIRVARAEVGATLSRVQQLLSKAEGGVPLRSKAAQKDTREKLGERLTMDGHELSTHVNELLSVCARQPRFIGAAVEGVANAVARVYLGSQHFATATTSSSEQAAFLAPVKLVVSKVDELLQCISEQAHVDPRSPRIRQSAAAVANAVSEMLQGMDSGAVVAKECADAINTIKAAAIQVAAAASFSDGSGQWRSHAQMTSAEVQVHCAGLHDTTREFVDAVASRPEQVGVFGKHLAAAVTAIAHSVCASVQCASDQKAAAQLADRTRLLCDRGSDMLRAVKEAAEARVDVVPDPSAFTSALDVLRQLLLRANTYEATVDAAIACVAAAKASISSAALQSAAGVAERSAMGDALDVLGSLRQALTRSTHAAQALVAPPPTDSMDRWLELVAQHAPSLADALKEAAAGAEDAAAVLCDMGRQEQLLACVSAGLIAAQAFLLSCKDGRTAAGARSAELERALDDMQSQAHEITAHRLRMKEALEQARRTISEATADAAGNASSPSQHTIALAGVDAACNALVIAHGADGDALVHAIGEVAEHTAVLCRGRQAGAAPAEWSEATGALAASALDLVLLLQRGPEHNELLDCTDRVHTCVMGVASALRGAAMEEVADGDVGVEFEAALARIRAAAEALERESGVNATLAAEWQAPEMAEVAEQIVESARTLSQCNVQLLEAAQGIQSKHVSEQRSARGRAYRPDKAWEHGLVTAAQEVADANADLVTYANKTLQSEAGEEMLLGSLRLVGAATARLVSAARVKVKTSDPSYQELTACAKKITRETQALAKRAALASEKRSAARVQGQVGATGDGGSLSATTSRVQDLEEQARIAKLEMELEQARRAVYKRRKQEYKE